jgi:hypothetical protein
VLTISRGLRSAQKVGSSLGSSTVYNPALISHD